MKLQAAGRRSNPAACFALLGTCAKTALCHSLGEVADLPKRKM